MSDFLSKFSKDNYKNDGEEKKEEKTEQKTEEKKQEPKPKQEKKEMVEEPKRVEYEDEVHEIDPTYRKKRRLKFLIIALVSVVLIIASVFIYYTLSHVNIPNLVGKSISESRIWADKHNITFNVKQEFNVEHRANTVIKQKNKPGSKVKKGGMYELTLSKGADPDEKIKLPDFKTMDIDQANEWIEKNKATSINIVTKFDDKVEARQFISFEIRDKTVKKDNYKRKDNAILYYSQGKEEFEKNISVIDFSKKTKQEIQSWAQENGAKVVFEEKPSSSIEKGKVVSQSVSKDTMVAKNEEIKIVISTGVAVTVPDFNYMTMEKASDFKGMNVIIRTRFSNSIKYGKLISQSVEKGKLVKDNSSKDIILVYSIGRPYIDDLRKEKTEKDLQKYFFDEFESKGANINYVVYYIDSTEKKGTVVAQSTFNRFLPLRYTIKIGVSRGRTGTNLPSNRIDNSVNYSK